MGGSFLRCATFLPPSVVIHDFDMVGVPFAPGKADPPAVVDPDTVLAGAAALQSLQPVAADGRQIGQTRGSGQPPQPFVLFRASVIAAVCCRLRLVYLLLGPCRGVLCGV